MTKYQPLETHLRKAEQEDIPMTFEEIEKIIGAELPASAFKHRAWWSNNPSNSVITHAWLDAGYKSANVDMPGRRLMFRSRAHGGDSPGPGGNQSPETDEGGPTGNTVGKSPQAAGNGFFSRIFGALRGTVTVRPGTDLTAPVDVKWKAGR